MKTSLKSLKIKNLKNIFQTVPSYIFLTLIMVYRPVTAGGLGQAGSKKGDQWPTLFYVQFSSEQIGLALFCFHF